MYNQLFEQILYSQDDDWYSLIEQKLSEYVNEVSLAIIGEESPIYKSLDESKMTDKDFVTHLLEVQSKFNDIKTNLGLSKTIQNIDTANVPDVNTRINQHTASMKSLEIDLNNEDDVFKKFILSGTIRAYKFILQKIIKSITDYNTAYNTNFSEPRPW